MHNSAPVSPAAATADPEGTSASDTDIPSQNWTTEERSWHQLFLADVVAAETTTLHQRTKKAMDKLRQKDPPLHSHFQRCLRVVRDTTRPVALKRWREHATLARNKRPLSPLDGTWLPSSQLETFGKHPLTQGKTLPEQANEHYIAVCRAERDSWRARIAYLQSSVNLATVSDAYLASFQQPGASLLREREESMARKQLFREMRPQWQQVLPLDFNHKDIKRAGLATEWHALHQAVTTGRRWKMVVDNPELGWGALILVETERSLWFLQKEAPLPIFLAWTALLPRVHPGFSNAAKKACKYYSNSDWADLPTLALETPSALDPSVSLAKLFEEVSSKEDTASPQEIVDFATDNDESWWADWMQDQSLDDYTL